MLIGIFSDTHDHLDHIRLVVSRLNEAHCDLAVFAGDFVSTIAVPPLRALHCPLVGCFGDNEGNKPGLRSGLRIIGHVSDPPARYEAPDGTRFVIAHMRRQLRGIPDDYDVAVFGHSHKPLVDLDDRGRLWINPGETSGWTFGRPTFALLDTSVRRATIHDLLRPAGAAPT